MESSLGHAIFVEGAALYRDIRKWRVRRREELRGYDGTVTAPPGRHTFVRSKRLSSPLHVYYPFLFHTFFQEIQIETVRELALADRLYTEHLLSYDRILDQQVPTDTACLFLAHLEHMQSLKSLYRFFPVGHPFWGYFYDCYFETWQNVREERLHHSHRIGDFPITRFCKLARGKTALLRPFTVALAFLSNRTEPLNRLSLSLDQHHIALVLIDDLEDWRQDFRNFNFTFLLTRLIQKTGLTDEIRSGRPVSPARIGRLLYATGLAERQLRLAEVFFQKANETVGSFPLSLWKQFNNGFRSRCRALRHDLAEIRRREERRLRMRESLRQVDVVPTSKALLHPTVQQLRAGINFLANSQALHGAFPLSQSPHAYMCPSESVAPSRSVTSLIIRSLQPLKGLDPSVKSLLRLASHWLDDASATVSHPGLPAPLERAFVSMRLTRHQLSQLDSLFTPTHAPLPDGLFWANLLYTCFQKSLQLPRLTAFVTDCLLRGFYTPWSDGVVFGPVAPPWTRCTSRPLLPLLLFCQALGKKLPQTVLHDYLLWPYRATQSWNNTTEISMTLLCLLLTDYNGPELPPAIRKLSESQEQDGSWASNAIYNHGTVYYGSRELTTAWCLEVLFRYHFRTSESSGPSRTATASPPSPALPQIVLHPGVHDSVRRHTRTIFRRMQHWLPSHLSPEIFIGQWPGMPSHFLLPKNPKTLLGINQLALPCRHPLSTAKRPLKVEIVLALMLAARYRMCGPLQDILEHIHVAGLALCACRRLWPDESPWRQAGMDRLDWLWCQANERFLWEELGRFSAQPCRYKEFLQWLRTELEFGCDDSIPKGGTLYLGLRLGREMESRHPERDLTGRLCKNFEEVRRDMIRSYCN